MSWLLLHILPGQCRRTTLEIKVRCCLYRLQCFCHPTAMPTIAVLLHIFNVFLPLDWNGVPTPSAGEDVLPQNSALFRGTEPVRCPCPLSNKIANETNLVIPSLEPNPGETWPMHVPTSGLQFLQGCGSLETTAEFGHKIQWKNTINMANEQTTNYMFAVSTIDCNQA